MCDRTSQAAKTGRYYVQCNSQSVRVWQRHRTIHDQRDGAAKSKLTDNCTVSSPAMFLSHAKFCRTCRQPLRPQLHLQHIAQQAGCAASLQQIESSQGIRKFRLFDLSPSRRFVPKTFRPKGTDVLPTWVGGVA